MTKICLQVDLQTGTTYPVVCFIDCAFPLFFKSHPARHLINLKRTKI